MVNGKWLPGYAFQNQDTAVTKLEIRVGNVLFNTNPTILRTVLMKKTEVQICMYGEVCKIKNFVYY